jgi:hypothetical protein
LIAAIREWSLRNLARPAGMQAFSPEIDGLRFIAIVAVVAYHAADGYGRSHPEITGDPLWTLLMQGHFGVPLFFAISGYIIARPFLGSAPPTLRAYFWRRLTRLEPPYFVNLLVVFLGKVLVLGIAATELWPHLLASFFYLHNLIYGAHSLVNGGGMVTRGGMAVLPAGAAAAVAGAAATLAARWPFAGAAGGRGRGPRQRARARSAAGAVDPALHRLFRGRGDRGADPVHKR